MRTENEIKQKRKMLEKAMKHNPHLKGQIQALTWVLGERIEKPLSQYRD